MNRPMVWISAAFACGIAAGAQASPQLLLAGLLAALITAFAITARSYQLRDRALLCSVFLLAGAALGWSCVRTVQLDSLAVYERDHLPYGASLSVEGLVRTGMLYRETPGGRFILDVDTVQLPEGTIALTGGVSVRCFDARGPIFAGERVRVRGRVALALSPVNHGIGSIEDYLRARGVHSSLGAAAGEIEHLSVEYWRPGYWISRLRQAECDLLHRCLPAETLPFVLAVWLGESGTIESAEYDDFVASGTAHVLSVSGVHVAIIYLMIEWAMKLLTRSPKRRAAAVIVGVIGYALLAGAQVATLRSAAMFALYKAADLVDREPDAPTTLGLSAFVFLLLRPQYIFDAGFLLSYLSVASMLLFQGPISERLPIPWHWLRSGIATTLAAQIISLPLAAHFFHLLPIYGIVANLIVVPLLSAVLGLCLLTTLGGLLLAPIGVLFGQATHVSVLLTRRLVDFFAALPGSALVLPSPAWYAVALYWLAAYFAAHALRDRLNPRRYWAATACCFIWCLLLWVPRPGGPGLDLLDVGHGDAMFLRTPGGTTLLVDGGDRDDHRDLGRSVVVPFLLAHGVRHLDYVALTHSDRDHIGGLFEVIRRIDVGTVLISDTENTAPLQRDFLGLCAARGVPVEALSRGDSVRASGAEIAVLHPPQDWGAGETVNNRCLVLRVSWPGFSLLCAGDIERPAEQVIAQGESLPAHILKVPHHGSGTSSTETFLNAVSPELAICSTGSRPNRVPMDPQVVQRYGRHAIPLKRTDCLGGLHLEEAEGQWRTTGAREARGYTLAPAVSAAD